MNDKLVSKKILELEIKIRELENELKDLQFWKPKENGWEKKKYHDLCKKRNS